MESTWYLFASMTSFVRVLFFFTEPHDLLRVDVKPSVCPGEEVGEEEDLDEEAATAPLELEVVCELEQIDDDVWRGKRRVGNK